MDRSIEAVRAPLVVELDGEKNVRVLEQREVKRRRQYAHHDALHAMHRDGLIERDPSCACEGLADDGYACSGCPILVAQEIATTRDGYTKEPKEARGHLRAAHHSCLVRNSDDQVARIVTLEAHETSSACAPVGQCRIGCGAALVGADPCLPQMHEAARISVRQRLEQRRLRVRKNGSGPAEAETDR